MNIQGHWKLQGFMIKIHPFLWADEPNQKPLEYRPQIQRMSFTKLANGGDWDMTVAFTLNRNAIENLYNNGVGRFVEVFDVDGLLFTGIVNRVNANLGTFSGSVGTLLNIDNRVLAVYSALDTSDITEIVGIRERTDWYENSDSQDLYGIQERVLSIGGQRADEVPTTVQTYLSDSKYPETNERITIGQSGNLSVDIEIVGLAQLFKKYVIEDTNTGTQDASDKIISVLDADPNGVFSSDKSLVTDNTLQVSRKENDLRTAWQVLKSVYSQGDANFDRWIFGINKDRKAYYKVVPSEIRYKHRLSERDQPIFDRGVKVNPWRVEPGHWMRISDFLVGKSSPISVSNPDELRTDKRTLFIEEVTFRYPYQVSIKGGKVGRTSQLLAQAGLAGIG